MKPESLELLSNQELMVGAGKAVTNARDLATDGLLLMQNKRYARAYTMFQLANEELGKVLLLHGLMIERHQLSVVDYRRMDNKFRKHQPKTVNTLMFNLFYYLVQNENGIDVSKEALHTFESARNVDSVNDSKNASLYVDIKDGVFVSPTEVITQAMRDDILKRTVLSVETVEVFVSVMQNIDYKQLGEMMRDIDEVEQESLVIESLEKILPGWKFPKSPNVTL
jgi:AbiV family abortive infection protein